MGLFGTLSPSDCHPAGPYVAGGSVGPDEKLKVLEPLEHSVLDHADPADHHAVIQEVLEPLEHSVLDSALDGRPMEGIPVLEPLEHSVLDHADPAGQHAVIQEVLEPLEHSVLDSALDGRPIEGIPVLEPLEHSVLVRAMDSGLMEGMSHLEPFEHSVLNAAQDDQPRKVASVLEPLEHSVLEMTLDSSSLEEISDGEPLAHLVLKVILNSRPMERIPDLEPLEHSVLGMALDSGLMEGISQLERLEHSVLNAALNHRPTEGSTVLNSLQCSVLDMALDRVLTTKVGGPQFGWLVDRKLSLSDSPRATRDVDLELGRLVPLPAGDVGRVTLSPADGRLRAGDVNTDEDIATGLQCWNTKGDMQYQYETFNGMPVYYGSDLYDSEDSDWDDLYALASTAYVEDYNFDVPEGMELMVHRHRRDPDSLDVLQDCQTDVAPVYQTVSCVTRDEWDNDSLTEAADADDPNMDDFY